LLLCSSNAACISPLLSRAIEVLCRAGAWAAATRLFRAAGAVTPWVDAWQTPPRYVTGVHARPVWGLAELHEEGTSAAAEIMQALQDGFPRILEDLERIRRQRWPPAYGPELIRRPWNWTKVLLYDGDLGGAPPASMPGQRYESRKLHAGLCATFAPRTCEILHKLLPGFRYPNLPYLQPDHEQVAFFHLAAGSKIAFHRAMQNARLTMHLCLSGCGGRSQIQVGPHVLRWQRGKVIAFDDSYLHRVSIDPHKGRWILHVMAVHPNVETPAKMQQAMNAGRVWPS